MKARDIFRRYANERRAAALTGYRTDVLRGITRYTPIAPDCDGLVTFSELTEDSIDDAISMQADHFGRLGLAFEWKVYDFDTPDDLAVRLEASGFERGDTEGFLVYRTEVHSLSDRRYGVRIDRVTTTAGIHHVVAIQEEVWGRSFPWLAASLLASLERSAVYCAYDEDVPVGTGWIEFPQGATFAELHGGSVLPARRNRGIYSALFDIRVDEARRRGVEFLAVDAAPMSRPILLKKGFTHVCDTIPFRKQADQSLQTTRAVGRRV